MAFALPDEVATFLNLVPFPTVPILPGFITHTIVKVPCEQAPWFRYEQRERSGDLLTACRIILQSNYFQFQR
jgi:hypothetical protein